MRSGAAHSSLQTKPCEGWPNTGQHRHGATVRARSVFIRQPHGRSCRALAMDAAIAELNGIVALELYILKLQRDLELLQDTAWRLQSRLAHPPNQPRSGAARSAREVSGEVRRCTLQSGVPRKTCETPRSSDVHGRTASATSLHCKQCLVACHDPPMGRASADCQTSLKVGKVCVLQHYICNLRPKGPCRVRNSECRPGRWLLRPFKRPAPFKGSGDPAFRAAQARVKKSLTLSEVPFEAFPSVDTYRAYVLMVDTLPVRGLVYAIAESSTDPRQDGSIVAAIELGSYTRMLPWTCPRNSWEPKWSAGRRVIVRDLRQSPRHKFFMRRCGSGGQRLSAGPFETLFPIPLLAEPLL